MRAIRILIVAAGVALASMALAPPADAGHLDWSFGVGFHVGGLHFRIGFAPSGWGGYPGPFFFTTQRLHYPGYACSGACFRRGPAFYHHASCPLLSFHFRRGGYGPDYYVGRFGPPGGYWRGYPARPYGYYYRPGYRYRPYGTYYYRDRHSHRGHHDRDRWDSGHRGRGHRSWRPEHGHESDHDRGRGYRSDPGHRGGGGEPRHAEPRRGARQTRPPR